jgi:hypothetical protein
LHILTQEKSDPIYGSLGPQEIDSEKFDTPETRLERILRKKRPIQYELDSDVKET